MTRKTEVYDFQSIPQKYSGCREPDLQLRLDHCGPDAVVIELIDIHYQSKRHQKLKLLLYVTMIYALYCAATRVLHRNDHAFKSNRLADLGFCVYSIAHFISMANTLRKRERLFLCTGFGIQLETEFFLSRRTSNFIPAINIYDFRINEVIEQIDIHYVLILRSKGQLFKETPIIPIFNSLLPTIDCLEFIYKVLRTKMEYLAPKC